MAGLAPRRVVVVTNIPTPYRVPLFRELAKQLEARAWTLKVVFGASGYARRQWRVDLDACGFEHRTLASRSFRIRGSESASFDYPGLFAVLKEEAPDVVVVTGYSAATMKLWLRSWIDRVPYVLWSGTIASAFEPISIVRKLQRRMLVRRAAAFVAYGSKARDYLRSLGAPADRIHLGINTVDTGFFATETARLRNADVPGQEVLCIGDLTTRKGIDLLLPAFARAATGRPQAMLTLVGDGPERERLERQAAALGIAGQVRFEGYRQRHELPAYLARARCLAFPTRFDIWGLVLPEAMAACVPCLASVQAGATDDLIEDGVTGFKVDFVDTHGAAERLAWMLDHPAEAVRMGRAAGELIRERASLAVSASGFVSAVEAALEARAR